MPNELEIALREFEQRNVIVDLFVDVVGRKCQALIPADLTVISIKQRQVATRISAERQHKAVFRRTAPVLRLRPSGIRESTLPQHAPVAEIGGDHLQRRPVQCDGIEAVSSRFQAKEFPLDLDRPSNAEPFSLRRRRRSFDT